MIKKKKPKAVLGKPLEVRLIFKAEIMKSYTRAWSNSNSNQLIIEEINRVKNTVFENFAKKKNNKKTRMKSIKRKFHGGWNRIKNAILKIILDYKK